MRKQVGKILGQVACQLFLALALCALAVPAHATSFKFDFVEMNRQQLAPLMPQLVSAYPDARFLVSGLTSPSGKWTFVRVEDRNACDDTFCLTVIVHEGIEWKLLVKVSKEINGSLNYENGESIQFELNSKEGPVVLRYMGGEKVLYLVR